MIIKYRYVNVSGVKLNILVLYNLLNMYSWLIFLTWHNFVPMWHKYNKTFKTVQTVCYKNIN
jgi:hypothetical protein